MTRVLATSALLATTEAAHAAGRGFLLPVRDQPDPAAPVTGQIELYAESHAVVIGIDRYDHGWPRLGKATEDADLVAKGLEAQGFSVEVLRDVEGAALETALKTFFVRKGRNEGARLLVWFSGHGYTDHGEGFLVPSDGVAPTDPDFRLRALSLRRFGELMRLARARHAMAIFDACFAGTVFQAARGAVPPAITRDVALPVRAYISSGDASQEVSDDGQFRTIFLRALRGEEPNADANHDGFLTGTELGFFLDDRVTNLTERKQTPRYGKLRDGDWDRGDFVFAVGGSTRTDGENLIGVPDAPAGPTVAAATEGLARRPTAEDPSADALTGQRFRIAGLDRPAYDDYRSAGLPYPVWAKAYNAESESLAGEIGKWVLTVMTATSGLLFYNKASQDGLDGSGVLLGVTLGLGAAAGVAWGLDLADVGGAPDDLPELPTP